jgi:hypothetical protein
MPLSYNTVTSGSAAGEDFTITVGSSGFTKSDLGRSFGSGNYICTSSLSDATLDIYFLNEDGTVAGYANATTATTSVNATKTFRYVVVYGATSNDTLTFQYKTVVTPGTNSTTDLVIGPRIISIATSSLPNQNATTSVTGQNFATDVEITFSSATPGYTATAAKSVVRSSSTSLIITRPDNMPTTFSPYTITAVNPNTVSPTSSNVHVLTNCITAGNAPVWVTSATLPTFTRNSSYSTTIQATDADGGSSVTYSYVSGSLPTGITFNTSTATFSGTPTTALTTTYTVRATDSGNNYVDRQFTFTNASPTWSTTSPLPLATVGSAYSTTVTATDDSGSTPTYSILSGSLPSGLSLNSATGAITGTPSSAPSVGTTFVLRAADANGYAVDRTFTIPFPRVQTFTSSGSWTAPSGVTSVSNLLVVGGGGYYGSDSTGWLAGGGGAGGYLAPTSVAVTPGTTYTITVGGRAGSSTALGYTAYAGGNGGPSNQSSTPTDKKGGNGASGGGGGAQSGPGGTAIYGAQGYNGGNGIGFGGGVGGGGGGAGSTPPSNYAIVEQANGATNSITGSNYEYSRGGAAGRNYYYGAQYTNPYYINYGWGGTRAYAGSGGTGIDSQEGGPGIVVLKYNG